MTRILIADADPELRTLVKHHLTVAGYRVVEAESGQAALEALDSTKVEMVLTETNLADMDGPTILSSMRGRGQDIPVIFVTATLDTNMVAECMGHGLSDFILKPLKPEELLKKIEKVLGPLPEEMEARGIDLMLVDDMEKLQTALQTALGEDHTVHGATTGAAALELAKQHTFPLLIVDMVIPDEDSEALAKDLHKVLPYARRIALYSRKVRYPSIRAREAGFDGFLVKPFIEAQLKSLMAAEEVEDETEVATLNDGLICAQPPGERTADTYFEELSVQLHNAIEELAADCSDEVILDLREIPESDSAGRIIEDTLQQCMDACIDAKVISGSSLKGKVPENIPNFGCLTELLGS